MIYTIITVRVAQRDRVVYDVLTDRRTPRDHNERNRMTATTTTPKALAAELGVSPKVLRAYLRRNHTRVAEAKNTTWVIPTNVATAARKAFAKNVATD
jgi:hypothetical protein